MAVGKVSFASLHDDLLSGLHSPGQPVPNEWLDAWLAGGEVELSMPMGGDVVAIPPRGGATTMLASKVTR